jgi:hypothetical protein
MNKGAAVKEYRVAKLLPNSPVVGQELDRAWGSVGPFSTKKKALEYIRRQGPVYGKHLIVMERTIGTGATLWAPITFN